MSKFWDKFWNVVEKMFEPLGKLFDKLEFLTPYLAPIFALIADLIVAYSVYFIIATPEISWLWVFPLLFITVPVLYFFNKGSIDCIKEVWLKKGKKNEKEK
jgi:hypothetical protein